jgi:hypothetical protein
MAFQKGHQIWKGKKHSDEAKLKKSLAKKGRKRPQILGEKHPNWKDDKVGYHVLHSYVKRYFPKSIKCQNCGKENTRLDLSNITGKYGRDISNWKYLCCACHNIYDFERNGKLIPADRRCCVCGSDKTRVDRGHATWFVIDRLNNLFQCRRCYQREYYMRQKLKYMYLRIYGFKEGAIKFQYLKLDILTKYHRSYYMTQ